MSLIKICGLTSDEAVDTALEVGVDMIGFVFFARSPRNVTLAQASRLRRRLEGHAKAVALTVDASEEELDKLTAELAPDLLQLHGRESSDQVAAVRHRYGLPVIKAIGVATNADLADLASLSAAEWILLDAKAGAADLPGGNGRVFDWTLVDNLRAVRPIMLSGGLSPETVREAIVTTKSQAVDVSSGVESALGIKSPDKIRAFVAEARAGFASLRSPPLLQKVG